MVDKFPTQHEFVLWQDKVVPLSKLGTVDFARLEEAAARGEIVCPTCHLPLHIQSSNKGLTVKHVDDTPIAHHEYEDQGTRQGKRALAALLTQMFPEGHVK